MVQNRMRLRMRVEEPRLYSHTSAREREGDLVRIKSSLVAQLLTGGGRELDCSDTEAEASSGFVNMRYVSGRRHW